MVKSADAPKLTPISWAPATAAQNALCFACSIRLPLTIAGFGVHLCFSPNLLNKNNLNNGKDNLSMAHGLTRPCPFAFKL
jgi:hypothetical protein